MRGKKHLKASIGPLNDVALSGLRRRTNSLPGPETSNFTSSGIRLLTFPKKYSIEDHSHFLVRYSTK